MLIFSWEDSKEVRPLESTTYGILNDTEFKTNPDIESALHQYGIEPVPWSKRDEYVVELAE